MGSSTIEKVGSALGNALREATERLFPGACSFEDMQPWTGMRPATPTGEPVVGRHADGPENLWLNTGHGALGFTLAFGTANPTWDGNVLDEGGDCLLALGLNATIPSDSTDVDAIAAAIREAVGRAAPLGRPLQVVEQAAGGEHVAAGPHDHLEHPKRAGEGRCHRLVEHGHAVLDVPCRDMPPAEVGQGHGGKVLIGRCFGCSGRLLHQPSALVAILGQVAGDHVAPSDHDGVTALDRQVLSP